MLKVQAVEYTQPFQHLLAKKETSSDILGSICTKLNDILTKTIECWRSACTAWWFTWMFSVLLWLLATHGFCTACFTRLCDRVLTPSYPQMDNYCNLSWENRLYAFGACFVIGIFLSVFVSYPPAPMTVFTQHTPLPQSGPIVSHCHSLDLTSGNVLYYICSLLYMMWIIITRSLLTVKLPLPSHILLSSMIRWCYKRTK